jgi:hypothetical protein
MAMAAFRASSVAAARSSSVYRAAWSERQKLAMPISSPCVRIGEVISDWSPWPRTSRADSGPWSRQAPDARRSGSIRGRGPPNNRSAPATQEELEPEG